MINTKRQHYVSIDDPPLRFTFGPTSPRISTTPMLANWARLAYHNFHEDSCLNGNGHHLERIDNPHLHKVLPLTYGGTRFVSTPTTIEETKSLYRSRYKGICKNTCKSFWGISTPKKIQRAHGGTIAKSWDMYTSEVKLQQN